MCVQRSLLYTHRNSIYMNSIFPSVWLLSYIKIYLEDHFLIYCLYIFNNCISFQSMSLVIKTICYCWIFFWCFIIINSTIVHMCLHTYLHTQVCKVHFWKCNFQVICAVIFQFQQHFPKRFFTNF